MAETEEETEVIWENTVDKGTWRTWVTRKTDYTGRLRVAKVETDEVILDKTVGLSYQAMFGPDVADVTDWENETLQAIDKQSQDAPEEP